MRGGNYGISKENGFTVFVDTGHSPVDDKELIKVDVNM